MYFPLQSLVNYDDITFVNGIGLMEQYSHDILMLGKSPIK